MTITATPPKATTTEIAPGRLFIGGEWREAATGERRDILNPATGKVVTTVAWASPADVDAAVDAAKTAFDSGEWSRLSGRERSRVLLRISQLIRDNAERLAYLESVDVGKPISLALAVDVMTAADQYEYAASLAQHLDGAVRVTPLPAHAFTAREPLGVVAAITPFNFPLILSSSKIAPALAAGNAVVHKPAGETPLSALFMAGLFADAGVPAGIVNVVTGSGSTIGDHLIEHPDVAKVAFTGSTEVGSHAAALAGKHLKPITAELGGNAANIVFADANLDTAIGAVITAFVFNTGQFCMGGPRLLVERPIFDVVVGILKDAVPGVPFGDPVSPDTVVGPLVSQKQLETVERYVEIAKADGGTIVTGGARADINGGFFFAPTVITGLSHDSAAVAEEVFGPVLTVHPFDSEEEAIAIANGTPYGLAAGVQTSNIARAHRVAARLNAGIVWVNAWALLDPAVPFGGTKNSGWGREYGPESLNSYTRTKSIVISTAPDA